MGPKPWTSTTDSQLGLKQVCERIKDKQKEKKKKQNILSFQVHTEFKDII